jgi:succinyl-diaminopimelate desuccinylase
VPDKCTITVDTRLTPSFTKESAAALIAETVAQIDSARVTAKATEIRAKESWPPYKLDRELPLLKALQEAADKEYGKALKLKVVGPSNIGNYLAGLGIPAICGFGVNYKNIHAANECVEIASIETTYRIYVNAVEKLLTVSGAAVDKV